jgi:hypothetical protein
VLNPQSFFWAIQRKTDYRQDRTREGGNKISYGFEGTAVAEVIALSLLQSSLSAESISLFKGGWKSFKWGSCSLFSEAGPGRLSHYVVDETCLEGGERERANMCGLIN